MRKTKSIGLLFFSVALVAVIPCSSFGAATQTIIIPHTVSQDVNHEDYYFTQLLKLVFAKTEVQFGPVQLVEPAEWKVDKRLQAELKNNRLDLLWAPTSAELETEFIAVKFSLLKELNNYHLLLIRPESQPEFSKVRKLSDLRGFVGGTSSQWPDAQIFDQNSLPTVKAVGFGKFFKMLAANRFDYFSRGIYQIESDVNFYPRLHLVIEKDLMLYYKNEVYFFVSKNKPEIAQRLKLGLDIAVKDGSFDLLFNQIPRYRWAIDELKNHHRVLINLQQD